MKDLTRVQDILRRLLIILDLCFAQEWKHYFESVLNESHTITTEDDLKQWVRKITGVYGGMGSFNDLVLSKGWTPLKRENSELRDLRHELLQESMKLIESESKQQERFL